MSDLVDRAEAALRRLDASSALALYEGPANGVPEDQVLAGRVRALWLQRRWAAAQEAYALLSEGFPDSAHTAIARGVIALGQPDDPAFIGVMITSAERDDAGAIAAFREAVRLDPTSDLAAAGLSTALRVACRFDESESVLTDWLTVPEPSIEILLARAAIAIDRGHVDEVREYLDRVLAADPTDLRAIHCYVELDRTRWGHLLDDLVVEGAPAVASYLELRAWRDYDRALGRDGEERERLLAMADLGFAESIETGTTIPGAFSGRAAIANHRDDGETARRILAQGLEREPNSPQLSADRVWGIADSGERRKQLYQLLDRGPRHVDRLMVAYILDGLGQQSEARSLLADLTELLPDHRELIRANAWFDVVDGYPERALVAFRRLPRTYPDAIAGEIRALRTIGAIEQAEALYEETVAQAPAGLLVAMKREYAYCAMHEGRYTQAEERARSVLADAPHEAGMKRLGDFARKRATRGWWRAKPNDVRAMELARTDQTRSRVRAEFIPERVRERTLGRVRALEWELATLRAGEEQAASPHSDRANRTRSLLVMLAAVAVFAGLAWVAGVVGDLDVVWPIWVGLVVVCLVNGLGWGYLRVSQRQLGLVLILIAVGWVVALWWLERPFDLVFWDKFALLVVVVPLLHLSAYNFARTLAKAGPGPVESPVRQVRWRRRQAALRRRYPFASMLLDLEELAILLDDEHAMAAGAARERCARLFEAVAMSADQLIRRARTEHLEDESRPAAWLYQPKPYWVRAWLRPVASVPDALLEQRLNRCAASVVTLLRQYKRQVLLPGDETWPQLRQEVVRFAALACERRWDSLPQPEPENVARRFRARLAVSMRLVLTAAVGPAVLLAYELLPGERPPAPALVAILLYAGWPLLTFLIRFDPDFATKLNILGQWLPAPGKSGSGEQDRLGASERSDGGKK